MWGRESILVNFRNIQQVTLKNSPYKRKHQLSDIQIHTTGINVNIPFLKKDEAIFIADFILANIEFEQEIRQVIIKNTAAETLSPIVNN